MTTQTYPACLHTLARRLRYLRRYPNHASGQWGEDYTTGMAQAYDYALRVALDEFHIQPTDNKWFELMYGPQGEDPDLQYPE